MQKLYKIVSVTGVSTVLVISIVLRHNIAGVCTILSGAMSVEARR